MSYNEQIKKEITINSYSNNEIPEIVLSFLKSVGQLSINNNQINIFFTSFNSDSVKFIYTNLKKYFSQNSIITTKTKVIFGKSRREYKVEILNCEDFYYKIRDFHFTNLFCATVGIFLAAGSISSPDSPDYHLYISLNNEDWIDNFLKEISKKFNFKIKKLKYKNKIILYIKKSEHIADFLNFINCVESLFKYEDTRIKRDLLNSVNRLNNLDISNQKKINSVSKQYELVLKEVLKNPKLNRFFSKNQLDILSFKLNNPQSSLQELAVSYNKKHGVKINKAQINYLLIKSKKIYNLNKKPLT